MILDRSSLLFGMLRSLVSTILVCGSAKEAFSHLHRDGSISLQRAVSRAFCAIKRHKETFCASFYRLVSLRLGPVENFWTVSRRVLLGNSFHLTREGRSTAAPLLCDQSAYPSATQTSPSHVIEKSPG